MIDAMLKVLGLNSASAGEFVMLLFVAAVLATLVGLLIDALSQGASFGVYGNALILLSGMIAGLVAYATLVQPLRLVAPTFAVALAIASAVAAFLTLSFAKTSIER